MSPTRGVGGPPGGCATEGPLHETALLIRKEEGTTRTLRVPIHWREDVAAWIEHAKRRDAMTVIG